MKCIYYTYSCFKSIDTNIIWSSWTLEWIDPYNYCDSIIMYSVNKYDINSSNNNDNNMYNLVDIFPKCFWLKILSVTDRKKMLYTFIYIFISSKRTPKEKTCGHVLWKRKMIEAEYLNRLKEVRLVHIHFTHSPD